MEASLSSSGNKSLVPKGTQDTTREESGWTAYFDDFLSNQREHSSCSDAFCSPSLVSDAASYVVWNNDIPSNNQVLPTSSSMADSPNYPKKLNFKKTRSKEITYDESLEDTASSPLNSPKLLILTSSTPAGPHQDSTSWASLSSSGNKSLVPKGTQDTTREESGWTAYFDDFLSNQREHSSCSDAFCSPSLVSDAASYVVWNNDIPSNNQVLPTSSSMADSPNYPKKLNFKKTRSKEITYDESLEDTASSPLNSPKVMIS
ncbi:unnamed protein product [Ilex paraguariensis]|uniref:Uncharacterized protein n=1 Tax=Ilex paraguariensis TaxID=185542 RepID=A0ABC8UWU7_9AQUA